MMDPQKLQKLFQLAGGRQTTPDAQPTKRKYDKAKASKKLSSFRGAYKDPVQAWVKWAAEHRKDITPDTANEAWDHAEQEFPGSPANARKAIASQLDSEITSQDPTVRESQLRSTMVNAPDWYNQQKEPELRMNAMTSANQNMIKTKQVYVASLKEKLKKFDFTQLDPSIPADVHAEEAAILEAIGKLDTAQIVNGRFAALDDNGAVKPAFVFEQESRQSGILEDPEMKLVMDKALPILQSVIAPAMQETNDMTGMQNRAAAGTALQALGAGEVPTEEWGDQMALLNQNQAGAIDKGIEGIVAKNPSMGDEEAMRHALDIHQNYGGMIE